MHAIQHAQRTNKITVIYVINLIDGWSWDEYPAVPEHALWEYTRYILPNGEVAKLSQRSNHV